MRVLDNDIIISRNESFVYDRKIENKDGSPYIISSRLTLPMLRFTVAADIYHVSDDRYILNRYLNLGDQLSDTVIPKFYCTNPIPLMKNELEVANSFSDGTPGDANNPIPELLNVDKYNYALYYIIDPDTHQRVYRRLINADDTDVWTEYTFRLVLPFDVDITSKWVSRNYNYSIYLMDGTSYITVMIDEVARILSEGDLSYSEAHSVAENMTEQELYDEILSYNNRDGHITDVALIGGKEVIIDMSDERWSPYWQVDCDIPLLKFAKISISNDSIGGLQ